ncbi:MAG TPA: phage tail protein [Xanthobacteraceae bacterium]|nr:phage tail protein [Xanthobacteraceae bacterium]
MISRRDLIICSAMTLAGPAAAQEKPRLFVLPNGVSSAVQGGTASAPKRVDLEGWLVCNGASVYRSAYPELFSSIGQDSSSGDASTFMLPNLHVEYRDGQPVKGTAICPFSNFGSPAGTKMLFDLTSSS